MPSNLAHMLICHKAIEKLRGKGAGAYSDFADRLDDSKGEARLKPYLNLGSVGPDLFYYGRLVQGLRDLAIDSAGRAAGVEPFSYHLHSVRPNAFPLKLVEITFRDIDRGSLGRGEAPAHQDLARLAFVAGYLTHVAADQIIHPRVNALAGPYYRDGRNREKHRECEVFQDYFLYRELYGLAPDEGPKFDFFSQRFNDWPDCRKGLSFRNTEDWFRYFLQRGFAESYGLFPDEALIEDSVDNLLLALRACTVAGPYRKAAEGYGDDQPAYQEYVQRFEYLRWYREAVELAVVYLLALFELYASLVDGHAFGDPERARFLQVVSGEDLSCPLADDILDRAKAALLAGPLKLSGRDLGPLLRRINLWSQSDIANTTDKEALIKR